MLFYNLNLRIELKIQLNSLTFLLGFNLIVFLLGILLTSLSSNQNWAVIFEVLGGQMSSRIYQGDLWQLITANFFHLDLLHFIFNMFSLYKIGELVLAFYNGKKLFLTYIFGGLFAVTLSYFTSLLTLDNIYSLGASGSIFALVGLLLGGTLKKNRFGIDLPFSFNDILPFVAISFILGFLPGLNINNWAHFGGLLSGFIIGLLLPNSLSRYKEDFYKTIIDLVYYLSVFIFVISYLFLILNFFNVIK